MRSSMKAFLVGLLGLSPTYASAQSIAFFYGPELPAELLQAYDQVVVEPAHGFRPEALAGGASLVAYLAIGEVSDAARDRAALQPDWILGRNEAWKSSIVDLASPGFQEDLLERRFEGLWRDGYRAFFLDVLDSYQLAVRAPSARARQRDALVAILRAFRQRHPDVQILLNRGFDVLEQVAPLVNGVVAESLFQAFDAASGAYRATSPADQEWLLARLDEVRSRHKLRAIVIDYAPPGEREQARALARRALEHGLTPWVADGALGTVGVGAVEVLPRRVLLLMQQALEPTLPDAVRYLAPVLEHLGYVVEPRDVRAGLPNPVAGTVAGVVTWLHDAGNVPAGYARFVRAQTELGVPLLIFGASGLDARDAHALGIQDDPAASSPGGSTLAPRVRDALATFEAEPLPSSLTLQPFRVQGAGVRTHLSFTTARGAEVQALVTTRWGAWASSHFFAPRGLAGERAWSIDPFALCERVLARSALPAPDLTTENGLRLAMFTLRAQGLGAASRLLERPPIAASVTELLARYPVPHAFDLEDSADNRVSKGDRAAAEKLLRRAPHTARALPVGTTKLSAAEPWLTQLVPLRGASTPMANDYGYLPDGAQEIDAYRMHADTIARSGAPRRLLPIALDYHASSLASEAGLSTVRDLYASVFAAETRAIGVDLYRAMLHEFSELTLARTSDGTYLVMGARTLRTLRLPASLGPVDLARSRGVAVLHESERGRWVTFLPDGERSLTFAANAPRVPHLVRVNASVTSLSLQRTGGRLTLRFALAGHMPIQFALTDLPPSTQCELRAGKQRNRRATDARGELAVTLDAPSAVVELSCEDAPS